MDISAQTKKLAIPIFLWALVLGLVLVAPGRLKLLKMSNDIDLGYLSDVMSLLMYLGASSVFIPFLILLATIERKVAVKVSMILCFFTALIEPFGAYLNLSHSARSNLHAIQQPDLQFFLGSFLAVFLLCIVIFFTLLFTLKLFRFLVDFTKELTCHR